MWKEKKETEFYNSTRTQSGLRSECKDCTKKMTRLYSIKNRLDGKYIAQTEGNFSQIRFLCNAILRLLDVAENESLKNIPFSIPVEKHNHAEKTEHK